MATDAELQSYLESVGVMFEDAKGRNSVSDIINSKSFQSTIKKYFPKTSAKYGVIRNTPAAVNSLSSNAKINTKLTSFIRSSLSSESKNLKVTVYQVPDKEPNAYTIPGIHLGMKPSELTLSAFIYGTFRLKQYSVNSAPSGNKVTLTSDKPVEPLLVMTRGLADNKNFTNNEKMAIMLHEVGHWSLGAAAYQKAGKISGMVAAAAPLAFIVSGYSITVVSSNHGKDIALGIALFSIVLMILFAFINASLSRGAEFNADAFVKNAGRGQDLSDSMQKLIGKNPIGSKEELDNLATFADKISPIIDFLTRSSHPSMHRRSGRLLESEVVEEGIISSMTEAIAEKTINAIASRLDTMLSSKPTIPILWAFTSK